MSMQKHNFNDDHTDDESKAQITFEISPEIFQRIQKAAIKSNLSIKEYLEQMFPSETAPNEQQGYVMPETIERLRQLRNQILQDRHGKPFEDSTEIIRAMREDRTKYLERLLEE
jgi:hypothetical protein